MNSNILDYVILALVFAVVIHIFIRTFGNGNNVEGLGAPISSNCGNNSISYGHPTADLFEESSQEDRSEKIKTQQEMEFEKSPGNQDGFIQQFVLNAGKVNQEDINSEDENIQGVQNDFFNFAEKINNSTREDISPVDRINEMQTSRNNELVNASGKKISDIFDDLEKDNNKKIEKCKNPGCIIPTSLDNINKNSLYKKNGANGNVFLNYDVMFETDGVNNGGKFYGDIEGYDDMSHDNLSL